MPQRQRDRRTKTWFTAGVLTLSSLGVFVPSTGLAQHGPDRHEPGSVEQQQEPGPPEGWAYDTRSETTLKGTVVDVKTSRSVLYWFSRIHTLGLGHMPAPEKQLLLKTDTETVDIQAVVTKVVLLATGLRHQEP